jgi:hypothetical protein
MDVQWQRKFVFLLKFNTTRLADIASSIDADQKAWDPSAAKSCVLIPVSGEYDMVAIAYEGTEDDALKYANYLNKTKRYTVVSTLTGFTHDEFDYASGLSGVDPHRK